ncbi:hypothetical protein [Candidatus Harpocratesius sp.]
MDIFQRTYSILEPVINEIHQKTVMLIGLGTLGSTIACELAKSGISHFILCDLIFYNQLIFVVIQVIYKILENLRQA